MAKETASTEKKFLAVKELCERWMVSRTTLHSEVTRGRPKKTHIAGTVRFAVAEVERYERTSCRTITEDELFALNDRDISKADLGTLSRMTDPDQKRSAISRIASGLDPSEAMATAQMPSNATFSEVTHQNARVVADMDDELWLEIYCSEILTKLMARISPRATRHRAMDIGPIAGQNGFDA